MPTTADPNPIDPTTAEHEPGWRERAELNRTRGPTGHLPGDPLPGELWQQPLCTTRIRVDAVGPDADGMVRVTGSVVRGGPARVQTMPVWAFVSAWDRLAAAGVKLCCLCDEPVSPPTLRDEIPEFCAACVQCSRQRRSSVTRPRCASVPRSGRASSAPWARCRTQGGLDGAAARSDAARGHV
jgi:hypothetical protein